MRSFGADCTGDRRRRKSCRSARGPETQKCSSRGSSFGTLALSMSLLSGSKSSRVRVNAASERKSRANVSTAIETSLERSELRSVTLREGGRFAVPPDREGRMGAGLHIAEVANLVGDPARANILAALLDQRALTASELAYTAGVSPQTTSSHLGKLAQAHLLEVEKQGRHRYYRL